MLNWKLILILIKVDLNKLSTMLIQCRQELLKEGFQGKIHMVLMEVQTISKLALGTRQGIMLLQIPMRAHQQRKHRNISKI